MKNKILDKDVREFLDLYPKFKFSQSSKNNFAFLEGEVDICDIRGQYLDSFVIRILIKNNVYPYAFPLVQEISKKIERNMEWHIDKDGFCCLDIEHKLIKMAQRGINLIHFYQEKIYPFFSNTVYKKRYNEYANGEYPHFFEGVKSFYLDELGLEDVNFVVKVLGEVVHNRIPGRNDICICNQNKYKKCKHYSSIEFLHSLPLSKVTSDLKEFRNEISNNENIMRKEI